MVDILLSSDWPRLLRAFDVVRFWITRRSRRLIHFHYLHAEIADLAQSETAELRNLRAHLPENVFNRVNAVASAKRLEQVAQNFPIVPRISGWAHRAIQTLQSAFPVNHRAAFFGKPGSRQDNSRVVVA